MDVTKPFQLNELWVDPINNKVIFPEREVSAPHKLIKLLMYFSQNPNRLISNEELSDHVWDGVVSEGTRYSQIANLRKLLNDDPNEPRFLKTVPRKGYMFIASIKHEKPQKISDSLRDAQQETELFEPKKSKRAMWLSVTGLLVVVIIGASLLVWPNNKMSEETLPVEYQHLLNQQLPTVVIDTYKSSDLSPEQSALTTAGQFMVGFHFDQRPQLHSNFVGYSYPNLNREKYLEHFSEHSSDVVVVSWQLIDNGEFSLTIKREGELVNHPFSLANLSFSAENLRLMEDHINQVVQPLFPDLENKGRAFSELKNLSQFTDLQVSKSDRRWDLNSRQNDLSILAEMIESNPGSVMLKGYFLSTYLDIESRWGQHYSLAEQDKLAEPIIADAAQHPDLKLLAQHSKAIQACLSQPSDCRENFAALVEQTQSLNALPWLIELAFPVSEQTPFDLAQYYFQHWPLTPGSDSFFRFFYGAIENKRFDSLKSVLGDYQFYSDSDVFGLGIHGKTQMEAVQKFNQYYREKILPLQTEGKFKADDLRQLGTDAYYVIHGLINAGQLTFARQWTDLSNDGYAQLYGDFLINIWSNQWNTLEWVSMSALVKAQSKSLPQRDLIKAAYAEHYSGFPENALFYYEKISPELVNGEGNVNYNNIRFALHLSEIFKSQGNIEQSDQLVNAIKDYLEENPNLQRNAYFGLTDIQFYALNGQSELALEKLEVAIEDQQWLPSAYWLWPPINRDMLLSNLNGNEKFERLVQLQQAPFQQLCWEESC